MNIWIRRAAAASVAALLYSNAAVSPAVAQSNASAGIPANVLADLRAAALLAEQDKFRITEMTQTVSDPNLAARWRDENRQQSATTFGYVVSAAIAEHPASTEAIVRAAVAIAPDLGAEITNTAIAAYPGFRDAIMAGSSGGDRSDYMQTAAAMPAHIAQAPRTMPEPRAPESRDYTAPPPSPSADNANPIYDPWQPVNRPLFAVYQFLDDYLVRPIAAGYGWVVPGPIKRGVFKAFRNLESPIVLANDILQFDLSGAATTVGRFVVNSTAGGLGFFDVAGRAGLEGHPADFDQTLNHYGVPGGPYMVLPLIGPGTARHNIGRVVDVLTDPLTWIDDVDRSIKIGRTVGDGISKRETLIEPLDTLRKDSVDWYSTFRATYYQDRAVVLRKGVTAPSAADNELFDAAE